MARIKAVTRRYRSELMDNQTEDGLLKQSILRSIRDTREVFLEWRTYYKFNPKRI